MLPFRSILCIFVLLVILYVSPSLAIHANDESSMTALLLNTAGWPADWRVDNLTSLCTWTGITCNGNGRLTQINMDPKDLDFWINGTLPEEFFKLDALELLILPRMSLLGGTVPVALFNMTSLTSFGIRGSAQRIILPDTISPVLQQIRLGGTNISGTIPETWNGDNLNHFTLDNTQLKCPLPNWLLTKMRDGSIPLCSMVGNFISIIDGKFCGQIPVNETKCRILPTINPVEPAPASKADAVHSFGNENVWVELYSNSLYMYGVSNKTGLPSRREYVYIQFQGWMIYDDQHMFDISYALGWDPKIKYDQNYETYICDLIMSNGIRMTFSFHLKHPLAPRGLKFGFEIYRNDSLSSADQPLKWVAGADTKFTIATGWYLRQPHSINEPFGCDIGSPSFNGLPKCNSDIYQLKGYFDTDSNECLTYAADAIAGNTMISFSYPFCYIGDNIPDFIPRGSFDVYCSGVGSSQFMGRVKHISPDISTIPFSREDPSIQFSTMLGSFDFAPFNHSLVYDPDVRISLLFEPGDLSDGNPAAIAERATAIAVGVGVGVPLAVLFVAGAIAVFVSPKLKHAIFPFTRPDESVTKHDLLLDDNSRSPTPSRVATWSSSQPNAGKLTNVN